MRWDSGSRLTWWPARRVGGSRVQPEEEGARVYRGRGGWGGAAAAAGTGGVDGELETGGEWSWSWGKGQDRALEASRSQ